MQLDRLRKGLFLFIVLLLLTGCCVKKDVQKEQILDTEQHKVVPVNTVKKTPSKIEYDLYSSSLYDLPLFSIVEISKMPKALKNKIDSLLEASQGFYFLKQDEDDVFIILQNPAVHAKVFQRHDLQFAKISSNGETTFHNAGYAGIDGEVFTSLNNPLGEEWIFDETTETKRPLSHRVFDENNKVKFTEIWNYDDNISIKYAMKDADEKIVSILKESQNDDSNLRKEHIFYDNNGKITMSLTVNYDGPNISHLTFYNSHDSIDSVSLINKYENGLKIQESIYNENYELINVAESTYLNGERKVIKILDSEHNEIDRISS